MSSFVFMKLLETRAARYDLGMGLLSLGRIQDTYRAVALQVPEGSRVLEVGCGTGGVTAHLLERGCRVIGVDRSPGMLDIARRKLGTALDSGRLEVRVLNLIQLDNAIAESSVDCVVCCLVLSELSQAERRYALDQFCRLVRPGGTVVLADEVAPRSPGRRLLYRVVRMPMAVLTYLTTQTTTRHTGDLADALRERGLEAVEATTVHGQSFQIASGRKPACRLQPQP
ncbi:corrinoid protein-associated methyltransferase CpaM [Lentzea flaviverrucosa]|uniref:Demethylmenaquinone methyltransferase / 2-methoxy-6-polyprenyl-1,4-benzoquinol methylase n=1 Tax=Lentzea flaviverrucosa TaxID=200379 RepID=A0A1H9EP63_9PSEU|nr:corrinoid protein-associated methyltransferase CpaM [Lentzea flaviverrucosa]RDI35433.1 demethylmenaquinone methyltransferase/2-methoxy-6-polyprenyl-1,4-benzoquinol methylase [Lentzea flaviverrucosa]SEQ27367.1 demethylmenaquinone methyltransferase / 2-methoxy-6-polyprenyl-1,4-benzoquinol methylase [Lentzea flaviverrucosa]